MAMKMDTTGLDELSRMMANLSNRAQDVASAALFDGAAVMADAMNRAVSSIRTETFRYAPEGQTRKPSPQEKAALDRKVGIAKFRKNGSDVDTVIGVGISGYTQVAGKQKAVAVIARSINSGTSFMQKQPVFRKAYSQTKAAAEAAIVAKAEEKINELTQS